MTAAAAASALKTVREVCRKPPRHWVGDGFHVYPVFADRAFTSELSPFLMFDYASPKEFGPTSRRRGVGSHPHRGFETVTLAFQGEVEHGDSRGNSGVIGPGDVQWMTAGRGIVHEEFHSERFGREGGTFEMCQIWVNLPSRDKMTEPAYQGILDGDTPRVPLRPAAVGGKKEGKEEEEEEEEEDDDDDDKGKDVPLEDGYARIVAGTLRGTAGPALTRTPVNLWDVALLDGGLREYEFDIAEGHNLVVFVRSGAVEVGGERLGPQDVALMNRGGTRLVVRAAEGGTRLLVLSGEPLDEPIAARGPFVMNTQAELQEAMRDYQMGRFSQ